MLKNEFEERTKLSMTEDEFNGVNALYMACGDDIDKDQFCELYMTMDGRLELMHKIERGYQRLKESNYENAVNLSACREIISEAANAMLEISSMKECLVPIRKELEKKAWWLVGTKEVVKRKVKRGISLSPNEIEYIIENLK